MPEGTLEKQVVLDTGLIAAGTIPAYHFVKADADGKAVLCGDGEAPLGVSDMRATEGETVRIIVSGIAPIKVGTAAGITANSLVACNASGQADAGTAADAAAAIAKTAPAANGDIIQARIDDIISATQTIS